MEDPNLIATLIPVDKKELAKNAFLLEHNNDRYLAPAGGIAQVPTISSREPTPALQAEPAKEANFDYNSTHRIPLTFGKKPREPKRGFSFGTNPQVCDVLLGHRGTEGISGLHFCITFNEEKRLVLKDSSTWGTAVSYSGQAKDEVRRNFTWILDLEKEVGKWEIKVQVPDKERLAFEVELASHDTCQAEYVKNLNEFLDESRSALPPLDVLGIYSHTTTAQPSQPLTPRKHPVYISERKLGSGSFGGVDKVINVSTGSIYARKQFYEPLWVRDKNKRKHQKEDWLNRIRKEIRIMRNHPHKHIVQVMDFREEPSPLLVMPYFPLGNLEDLHSKSPIAVEETIDLLFQALGALGYLHPHGVAHRDLKPENILVESRYPLSIKLADFGLVNDKSDLKTFCGTRIYAAPEIYFNKNYTPSVDLWSLGVIVLQYAYGLPRAVRKRRGNHNNERWGANERELAWCKRIVDHANDWEESDRLIELLIIGMLQMKPEERLSASDYLKKGHGLGLFDGHTFDSGSATPTLHRALQGENSDDDGSTTIILGRLWDIEEISNYDDNGRTGFCSPEHNSGYLEPWTNRVPSAPSNGDCRRSQVGNFETVFEPWGGNIQAKVGRLNAQSTYPMGYKRQRSPAKQSSGKGRVKRRQRDVLCKRRSVSRTYTLSGQHLEQHDDELIRFRSMYDAVLALLTDLQLGDSANQVIEDHTSDLVGNIFEYLTQLNIVRMGVNHNEHSHNVTIIDASNRREILLANLTSSELMSSTADLAAHICHMLQLQSPQLRSTAMEPVDVLPFLADPTA